MKTALLFVICALISNSVLSRTKSYYLKININNEPVVHQFSDLEDIQKVVNFYYPEYHFNMSNEFKNSSYFHLKTAAKEIYAERIWMKRPGMFKRERESKRYTRKLII